MDRHNANTRSTKILTGLTVGAMLSALVLLWLAQPDPSVWLAASLLLGLSPALLFHCARLTTRLDRHHRTLEQEATHWREQADHQEKSARIARKRYQQILDHAGDAIFFIHPEDGTLVEVNRQAENLLGYSAEQARHLSLSTLFPGVHQRRYLRLVKRVLKHGYGEESNLVFHRQDGSEFIGAVHARLGEMGEETLVHGVLRDVTEVKRIEKELRQKNQDLLLINQIAGRAATSRDLDEMLTVILNEVTQAMVADGGGIYLLRHEGTDMDLRVHQGIEESVLAELRALAPGQGLAGRVAVSGHPRASANLQKDCRLSSQAVREAGWHGFQAIPLTAQGRTLGILFVFTRSKRVFSRDQVQLLMTIGRHLGTAVEGAELLEALRWQVRLTEASSRELERSRQLLRENLSRVEESNRTLARIDRMKSNFLALASHELRTPLTCVLSGAEMLEGRLQRCVDQEGEQILSIIHQGARRLESIVEDLLEVARIESQSIYLAQEPIHLPTLLQEVGAAFAPVMAERNLCYQLDDLPEVACVCGDSHHLKKAFQRLVENAVKFTPSGGQVRISGGLITPEELRHREEVLRKFTTSFFEQAGQKPMIRVCVEDSGVGIAPEEHVRVFDKFYEVGDITEHFTSNTRFGGKGVGLGLTLVKGMVEAHGGMVWVESDGTMKKGSAFHVLLPLEEGSALLSG
ncbi:MAG: ATP-binding protein [Desulfuromonadales bacterium]